MSVKPHPYDPPPEGFEWEPATEGTEWAPGPRSAGRCRSIVNGKGCGRCAVVSLNRSRRSRRAHWWDYCDEHTFGRWIEDGVVKHWRLVESARSETETT